MAALIDVSASGMQPGNRLERLIVMGPGYFRGDFGEAPAQFGATSAHAGGATSATAGGATSAHAGGATSAHAGAVEAEPPRHEATYGEGDTSIETWRSKPVRRLTWDAVPVNLPEFVSSSGSSSS